MAFGFSLIAGVPLALVGAFVLLIGLLAALA